MENYNTFIGMDVHARSIICKGLNVKTGECFNRDFRNCPTPTDLANWIKSLPQPVYCAYESGCTGFYLARELREAGIDCDVIAVSTLARSTKDKFTKCDKIDANVILKEISSPYKTYSVVWIPDEETEADRDIARLLQQTTNDLVRAKQKLTFFLMRNEYVWNEKTKSGSIKHKWTRSHWNWINSITFKQNQKNTTLNYYINHIKTLEKMVKEIKKDIKNLAESNENVKLVAGLMQCRGIDLINSFLIKSEIGDFNRFKSGRKVTSWVGLNPKNNSSGEKEIHGKITKDGNKYVRRALTEGLSAICCWNSPFKSCTQYKDYCSVATLQNANNANIRVLDKYKRLVDENKKHHNKAKIAAANELIKWIWIIGKEIQNA